MPPVKCTPAKSGWEKQILPSVDYKIVRRWTGPIHEPIDGVAFIGEIKPHQYSYAGFSGNGMTYSVIAALMFDDLINGQKNGWVDVYNPKRIPTPTQLFAKGQEYVEEFINGVVKTSLNR